MPKLLKRIICFLISSAVVAGCLCLGSVICNHPSEEVENTVDSFYREPENSLDVVMVGSSAFSKDFKPSVIWNKVNITSYCMAIGACSANIYSSIIKEVVTTQPDAILLVDLDGFVNEDKYQLEKPPIRLWLDAMPKNDNHTELIKKYFPDEISESVFPFIRYHRYMTSLAAYIPITFRLAKKAFLNIKDPLGGSTLNNVEPVENAVMYFNTETESEKMTEFSQQVFEEFLDFCREYSIKNIVFVSLPKAYVEDWQLERNTEDSKRMNYIKDAVKESGYTVYDYNTLNNPANLDIEADYADTLHLTTKGAEKFSEYFADWLNENYSFEEKDETVASDWNSRYIKAKELMTY